MKFNFSFYRIQFVVRSVVQLSYAIYLCADCTPLWLIIYWIMWSTMFTFWCAIIGHIIGLFICAACQPICWAGGRSVLPGREMVDETKTCLFAEEFVYRNIIFAFADDDTKQKWSNSPLYVPPLSPPHPFSTARTLLRPTLPTRVQINNKYGIQ